MDGVDDLLAGFHWYAVDRHDGVARAEPGLLRRPAGHQLADARARAHRDADGQRHADVQHEREEEVHRGTGGDDGHPLPDRLGAEAALSTGVIHVLSGHAHVAPEGEKVEGVGRAPARETGQSRAKADREGVHGDSGPFGHEEVAELVDHDHHAEGDDRGDDVGHCLLPRVQRNHTGASGQQRVLFRVFPEILP